MSLLAKVVLCFALLAVIDPGAASQESPKSLPACDLLSRTEIQAAVAARVYEGEARTQGAVAATCRFAGERRGVVTILIRHTPGEDWGSRQIERMGRSGASFRELPGIGDKSFLYDMKEKGAALCVFRGHYYIQVSIFRMGPSSAVLPAIEDLGRKAVARADQPLYDGVRCRR